MRHVERLKTLRHLGRNNGERWVQVNEKMLESGMDFETASKEIIGYNPGKAGMRTYARSEIIDENRENFAQVLQNRLLPYQQIVDAMEAKYADGKPNWKVRLDAVKLYCQLNGHDPRQGLTVNIGPQGDMSITINQVYALARYVTDDESRIAFYNEIKQGERRGMFNVTPGSLGNQELMLPPGNMDFPPVDEE